VCLNAILENLTDVLRHLGGLAHIDLSSLKAGCGLLERQTAEAATDLARLERCDDQPALTLLAGTTGTAKTVNVGLAVAGETDLDYVGDIGKIHSTLGVLAM
jgi:hypothetical protein